jgi:hypothetical protein
MEDFKDDCVSSEMPKYRSHKEVWAVKIRAFEFDGTFGTITPWEDGYADIKVDPAFCRKHEPKIGGYYVIYEDGYQSFSPADAFEGGYTRL